MNTDIWSYNENILGDESLICHRLSAIIENQLNFTEAKIWHAHPVWFIDGNPIVGYSKLKGCIRLLFWSGQSFQDPLLSPEGKFKAAEIRYTSVDQIKENDLIHWLELSEKIQWDYKNIVKRRGTLERLK